MKSHRRCFALVSFACLCVAGCAVGPNYHRPKTVLAPAYGELHKPESTNSIGRIIRGPESEERWWTVLHDPELNSLIERAVRGNRDLRQAVLRVRQARAQRGVVASGLFPEVNAAGYDRARGSKNVELPFGAPSSSSSVGSPAARREPPSSAAAGGPNNPLGEGGLPGITTDLYQAGFDASWEIDIFGGIRRALEAANANIGAAEEDRRAVMVSLLVEVASMYVELRGEQQRIAIARENLSSQRDTLALVKARRKAGFATEAEVSQQAADVALTTAEIPRLESGARNAAHALAYLVGQEPNAFSQELGAPAALPVIPPEIFVGIPSDLLRRRPDIRRAERRLAAATAQIGVAKAELFPKFSVPGSPDWTAVSRGTCSSGRAATLR